MFSVLALHSHTLEGIAKTVLANLSKVNTPSWICRKVTEMEHLLNEKD